MESNLNAPDSNTQPRTQELKVDALALLREQNEKRANEQKHRSILGTALSHLDPEATKADLQLKKLEQDSSQNNQPVDPAKILGAVKHDEKVADVQDGVVKHTADFLKTVPMFMPGKSAFALAAALYGLDEVKLHDKSKNVAIDICLGATKGILDKGAFAFFGSRDWCVAAQGTAIGATLGLVNQSLTRENYLNEQGHITQKSFGNGLAEIAKNTFDPASVAAQSIAFGVSGAAVETANLATHGLLSRSPLATNLCAGFIFGTAGSAAFEITKEKKDNHFDLNRIITESLIGGTVNSLAAIPGGVQSHFCSAPRPEAQPLPERLQTLEMADNHVITQGPQENIQEHHVAENSPSEPSEHQLPAETSRAIPENSLEHQRSAVAEWANARLENPAQKERFRNLMNRFEERCSVNGIPEEEVNQTYKQLSRLLSAESHRVTGEDACTKLAEQILYICANPEVTCQGDNNTCALSAIEKRMYTLKPSAAARLVTDIAITGEYHFDSKYNESNHSNHEKLTIYASEISGLLDADFESKCLHTDFDQERNRDLQRNGQRSRASQIFQLAAVNIAYAEHNSNSPGEQIVYQRKGGHQDEDELIARDLTGIGRRNEKVIAREPNLGEYDLVKLYNQIADTSDTSFVLVGPPEPPKPGQGKPSAPPDPGTPDTFTLIQSDSELLENLRMLDAKKQLPAIVTIDGGHPFISYNKSDGAHSINVTGVGPDQGSQTSLTISNHWFKPKSKTTTASILFDAMRPRSQWTAECEPTDYVESSDSESEDST